MSVTSRKGLALFSFRLSDEFISQYKDREPDWGYRDAAGNAVGEITFLRTYSRKKEDGGKERWYEVCERVVNGMYSIQKDHCKTNRLPWNDHKAQASAQEAYDRLFQFKWMPPGRGLWMMGSPLVNRDRNSAALQNPLHEDTRLMTRTGWQRLGDLEGQDIEVLTSTHLYARDHQLADNKTSKWAKATVSFIEEQPSVRITYKDTVGEVHEVVASRNHRWFVCRGDVGQKGWKRITSEELQEGDILPSVKPPMNYKASLSGQQHGFFFGDGSRTDGEFQQFGSSAAVMISMFGSQNLTFADRHVRIGQCPAAWAFLPEGRYREDKRYVLGFLQGYFAADGCVDGNGGMSISSARPEELAAVRELFLDLGIEVSRPRLVSTASNLKEERELWQMRINRWDVTASFFLKDEHRERWVRRTYGKSRKNKYVHILSIEDAGMQRVLCATVPTYEQFVIEGFALTSNCGFVSTANMPKNDPAKPFAWLMEASMLGIGVGFDTKGAAKDFTIHVPSGAERSKGTILSQEIVIPDDREGWVESMRLLINSYLKPNQAPLTFDYSEIRPAGSPIKTFGGTAAGPEPLRKGHDMIRSLFEGRDGDTLTRRDIADIGNILGVVVVSGNVRRSAELLMGSIDDPEFIQLKDPEVFPERQEWAFMSNNSVEVTANTDLSPIIEGIALNGEPGVIWMDITRDYGRLIDPPDYKDWRAAGFNPCLAGDTLINTTAGPRRIDSLSQPFWAVVNGKAHRATASWCSGTKPVYRLVTEEGYEVRLTADHKVRRADGEMIPAQDLAAGDKIVINDHRDGVAIWPGVGEEYPDLGYVIGAFKGDGNWERSAGGRVEGTNAVVKVWHKDDGHEPVRDRLEAAARQMPRRKDFAGWRDYGRGDLVMSIPRDVVAQYVGLADKGVLDSVEQASSDFQSSFLSGWFDADGHVEGWSLDKGGSIRLASVDLDGLKTAQRMLLRFGVKSRIYLGKPAGTSVLPDGKGGMRPYETKAGYRLVISSSSILVFYERIGFTHAVKREKVEKVLANQSFYEKPYVALLKSLVYEGDEPVYDLTVDDVHVMDANGFVVSNCAEQPLESYELCTLDEAFLNRHEDKDDFLRSLKFAYLYGKTVTLLPTHWPETNAVMQRNRRIGTSVSGVADFSDEHGLLTLRDWLNDGYAEVRKWDKTYSEWLAIRESIRVTTVKPSGTVSLLAGASPGVHWAPGGRDYLRGIVFGKDDPMVSMLGMAGYTVETSAYTPDTSVFIQFPLHTEAHRDERQVSLYEKANLAVVAQRYWSDNSVSVTLSFDAKEEDDAVERVLTMHAGQLKTASFLPMGNDTYDQMPYQRVDPQVIEDAKMRLFKVDFAPIYDGDTEALEAIGYEFCMTDACLIPNQ